MPDQYNATAPQAQARDFIVTLDTKGPLATKRHMWNGDRWQTESYGRAAIFTVERYLLSDIRDLANGLSGAAITRAPRRFVIRGDMIPDAGIDYAAAPRRLHARGAEPATLQPAAHHWIALDIDGLACPEHIDPLEEPDAAVEYAVEQLPAEFHSATCFWQFTASQGIKPGLSLRLWFWADRKLADDELKTWLADSPVDHAIFAPAQPIYTAFPIFDGAPDPVWWRCGLWEGDRDEITPPAIDVRLAPPRGSTTHSHGADGGSGYDYHRARIGDHPEGRGFFAPIKTAVASFFGRNGSMADTDWLRNDLEQAIRSADSSKHDAAYLETRVRDLDPLIEAIRERQAETEATAAEEAPTARTYDLPPAVDVAEGRAQLARIAADFSKAATSRDPWPKSGGVLGRSEPPVIVVNAAPGLGKTRTALEAVVPVVLQAEQNVLIAIPRHDLGDQQVADLAKIGITARTYRSRGAAAADGAPMCLETKRTGAIEDALGDVSTHACKDGKGNVCEHFETCGWQEQFRDPPDVWLVPHNNLYLKLPRGAASAIPKPDVTVIDENFVAGGDQEDVALDISDLLFRKDVTALYRPDKDGKIEGAAQLRATSERVHAVLAQLRGHVRIRPDMFVGLTADEVRAARRLELKRKKGIPDVVPGMPPDEAIERALRVKDHNQEILAKFWEYLAATLEDGFDESLYLRFSPECRDKRGDKTFPGVVISSRLELHKDITSRPVLHLDGTASETVVRRFFPHAQFHTINVQMPTTTTVALIQITDRAMSKGNAKSAKLLEEYRQYIDVVAADARGPVGVICLRDTEIALNKQASDGGMPFSPNVLPLVHYGATTGMNGFSDVSDLILIGRLEPPPYEMEKAARLLFKRPVTELPPPYYPRMARGMAMRGSDRVITVRGSYHPDEGVEALRWLACEGGQLQAMHRGRPINRGPQGALRIHIVSNVCLPIEVDFARTWDELRPSLAEVMFARGFWVSSHAEAAALFPDLFGNAAAAKTAMARERETGNEAYRVSLIEVVTSFGPRLFVKRQYNGPRRLRAFVAVRFRRAGSRGPAGWLIFEPEQFPDPAALLHEKLGCEVTILPDMGGTEHDD